MIRSLSLALLLLFSLSATSCLQPPSKTDTDGPVVPAEQVQDAIFAAWGEGDFSSVAQNEYLYIEQDQKISTLDSRVVYKEGTQVLERMDTPTTIDYRMLVRSTAMKDGAFEPVTSLEDIYSYEKENPSNVVPNSRQGDSELPQSVEALQKSMQDGTVGLRTGEPRNYFVGEVAVLNMLLACVPGQNWDVTCHNLQVSEGVRSAPTGVSSKPDCGGIPNCQIRYKKVSFELVLKIPASEGQDARHEKVIYDMTFSPDVPYMSRLMDFCYQGMVPAGPQKVLIKICNRVQYFERGNQTAP